jgi:hypothetical protein
MFSTSISKVFLFPYSAQEIESEKNRTVEKGKVDYTNKSSAPSTGVRVFLRFDESSKVLFSTLGNNQEFKDLFGFLKLIVAISDSKSVTSQILEQPSDIFTIANSQIISVADFYSSGSPGINFVLSSGLTEHLTCFALPYIAREELCTEYGIDSSVIDPKSLFGGLASEFVADGYKIISAKVHDFFVSSAIGAAYIERSAQDDKTSCFTDVFCSRNYQGVGGVFGIDLLNFAKKNTTLGSYFSNSYQLLDNIVLKQIKIKKTRVQGDQKKVPLLNSTKEEVVSYAASKVDLVVANSNYGFYTFVDSTENQDGKYQYSAGIDMLDKTYSFFLNSIEELSGVRSLFLGYYNEIFISGEYDAAQEELSRELIERQISKYGSNTPWDVSLDVYMRILFAVAGGLSKEGIYNKLITLTSPNTGNTSGMELFLLLVDELISKLYSILGILSKSGTTGVKDGTVCDIVVSIEHQFPTLWDGVSGKTIYDVLGIGGSGVLVVGKSDISGRFANETSKYFVEDLSTMNLSKNGSSDLNSVSTVEVGCSYLTVASTKVDGKLVDILGGSLTGEELGRVYLDLVRSNTNTKKSDVLLGEGISISASETARPEGALLVGATLEKDSKALGESRVQENSTLSIQQATPTAVETKISSAIMPLLGGKNLSFDATMFDVNKSGNVLDVARKRK